MLQSVDESQQRPVRTVECPAGEEPTIALVLEAKRGDGPAIDELMRRCLPRLERWVHGRMPAAARGQLDTCDLVQEVALHTLSRLWAFEPYRQGGIQWYLRQAAMNRIRDEIRKLTRRPRTVELPEDVRSSHPSPLAIAIELEQYRRYRRGLRRLRPRDRRLVVARIERGMNNAAIAKLFAMATASAANMAVLRAVRRLAGLMAEPVATGARRSSPAFPQRPA